MDIMQEIVLLVKVKELDIKKIKRIGVHGITIQRG